MMVLLVVGCIWTSWRTSDDRDFRDSSATVFKRSRRRVFAYLKKVVFRPVRLFNAPQAPAPQYSDEAWSIHSIAERQNGVSVAA
jgi:hypothetical protein